MKMVAIKLICMVLAMADVVVNMQDDDAQLMEFGGFTKSQNKTDAFMYAYEHLITPPGNCYNSSNKGILYEYQDNILKKFVDAHTDNLKYMFIDPITWCKNNIKRFVDLNGVTNLNEFCKKRMVASNHVSFGETQKVAVGNTFLKMKYYKNKLPMSKLCQEYYIYIKDSIKKYIEFTDVQSPSDYCNKKESPSEYLLCAKENGEFETKPNPKYNQPPKPPSPVHFSINQEESLHLNIIKKLASSSDVDKSKGLNIDLNEPPPDED